MPNCTQQVTGGWAISMKKNRSAVTALLLIMTLVLLGTTFYISTLLTSKSSPTQIQKTKASAVTYSRTVNLPEFGATEEPKTTITPTPTQFPTSEPTQTPTLLAQAPTLIPTLVPTIIPTLMPPTPTPTLSPLLAYKSTGGVTPTLIPLSNTGGMIDPTKVPSPTRKIQPTGIQQLPESGWIQTSTILFIIATSTILFSLLF